MKYGLEATGVNFPCDSLSKINFDGFNDSIDLPKMPNIGSQAYSESTLIYLSMRWFEHSNKRGRFGLKKIVMKKYKRKFK